MDDTRRHNGWHVWIVGDGNTVKDAHCFNSKMTARRWAAKNFENWAVRKCNPVEQGGPCVEPPAREYRKRV